MWSKIKSWFKIATDFPAVPVDPMMLDFQPLTYFESQTYSKPVSMGMPEKIEMSYSSETANIPQELFENAKEYILERLKLGIHPDEVEFDIVNMIADILDEYCCDEEGIRDFYKNEDEIGVRSYFKEKGPDEI